MSKGKMIYFMKEDAHIVDRRWVRGKVKVGPVRLMAVAEGYAMVRQKGCAPFVISEKDIVGETL